MNADAAVADLARASSGRVVAVLANRFGDLDLADDAVQEALARAAERWGKVEPIPDNPGGWLMTVARRIAIDTVRSRAAEQRRASATAVEQDRHADSPAVPQHGHPLVDDEHWEGDPSDQLRLVLLCCHPALSQPAQVVLTLRLVAGLTTDEIAAGLLIPPATVGQRISRAKRKIRDAGIPLALPAELVERLGMVHAVLYLTFNEGYLSRSGADGSMRPDLCAAAMRLTRSLLELVPDDPETAALLALQLFHEARRSSRFTPASELVRLADQDREQWESALIAQGNQHLYSAMATMRPGQYQLQALIASYHANASTHEETDWVQIAALYGQLEAIAPSPVVALNRSVAIAMADGPQAGLDVLASIESLDDYHLLHSTRAHLLEELGDARGAADSWRQAQQLTTNPAELELISRRLGERG